MRLLIILLFFSGFVFFANAQVCSHPGKDGNGINLSGIINTYYPGVGSASSGSQNIQVGTLNPSGATTPISAGDLLLIIQMQNGTIVSANDSTYGNGLSGSGYTSIGYSGLYEYVTATSAVSGGSLSILGAGTGNGLLNNYTSQAASTLQGQSTFQVIRVPQYGIVQLSSGLTSAFWNGSSGGVLVFDVAGSMYLNSANLNVNGRGFRGGGGIVLSGGSGGSTKDYVQFNTAGFDGSKGEGIAGTPKYNFQDNIEITNASLTYPNGSFGRGAPGNAGGGGNDGDPANNDQNSGGGGGGNQGFGGMGGKSSISKLPIGGLGGSLLPSSSRVFLGGGGGAGSRNGETGFASSGGSGGGIILIRAGSVVGSGTMSANGNSANNTSTDGGGGGGAGGSILISSLKGSNSNLNLIANGGGGANTNPTGVDSTTAYGPGGGGGGGLIITSDAPLTNQVFGSINGTTTLSNISFGATTGGSGKFIANAGPNFQIGIQSGASCSANENIVLTANNLSPLVGSLVIFTLKAVNNGPNIAYGTQVTDTLPTGFQYISDNGNGAFNPSTGVWSLGNLSSGSSASLIITVKVLGSGIYKNTGYISSSSYDPFLDDNISGISISPYEPPIPEPITVNTKANVPVFLINITQYDLMGTYPINPNSIDLDTLMSGQQTNFTLTGKGIYNVVDTSTLLFTPASGFSGIAQDYYTISDQFGNSSVQTAPIIVKVYPVAVPDTAITTTFIPILVSVWKNDLGLINPKSVQIQVLPKNGTAQVDSSGNILYAPKLGFVGLDSLSYSICDHTSPQPLCSNPGILFIKVGSIIPPVPLADSIQIYSGNLASIPNLTSNDIKGSFPINPSSIDLDTLTLGIQDSLFISGKGYFKVMSNGNLIFSPVQGFSGIVTDYYTVADTLGNRSKSKAPIMITVNPFAVLDTAGSNNGVKIGVKVYLNDLGNLNPKSVKIIKPPLYGQALVDTSNGNIIYTPNPGYFGKDSLGYSICDRSQPKALCSNTAYLLIRDYHTNLVPPTALSDTGTTLSGKPITLLTITHTDIRGTFPIDSSSVDLDTLTAGIQSSLMVSGKGTFLVDNFGDVRFVPVKGYSGIVSTPYVVSDINGNLSNTNSRIVIIVYPNAVNDSARVNENQALSIPVLANDLGNLDFTSLKISSPPQNGKFSINSLNGTITYTPNSNFIGKDSLSYTI